MLRRYLNGEERCALELVRRHEPDLLSYVYSYVENHDDSKDIVQEVFKEFFSMLRSGKYTEQGKLFHLLLKIAHHRIEDFFDKKKLHDAHFDSAQCDSDWVLIPEEEDAEAFTEEEMKLFRELVHALELLERKILIMRYHGRHSWEEIGEETGMSANSASHMYSRIVRHLRQEISGMMKPE